MADKKHRGTPSQHQPKAPAPSTLAGAEMGRIYQELRSSLARFAYRYFKTPQEIEDVVQEAFVKVIEAREQREILHPKSYMFQTVKNLALNRIAKSDYRLTDSLGDGIGGGAVESVSQVTPTMEEQFEYQERFELFCRAVRQLPIKCQRVYILRRVYGYSQIEIAEQMGISIKTVEAHLTKAIVRCTDYMDEQQDSAIQPPQPGEKHGGRYHG